MDLFSIIFELIDLRSFSNLWYWIALAVLWSSASHWVLGVPFDMVGRAAKHGGEAAQDLQDAVRIQVSRLIYIADVSGFILTGFAFFAVTTLLMLGFVYHVEFAQAVVLMLLPMYIVGFINLRTARALRAPHDDEALRKRLTHTRIMIQLVGVASIFVTALWGMYQNLTIGVLG
ncbi:component of SufBCD complex [Tritonibacter mobilis]|uniref:component of SufBCD complex n=1 Tax=Tritonibacter mobilis TaxID=379347 RepID=UPI001C08E79A|nr:component of SufBCD complex [Tritonibacter mobilis]MBU3035323.1 component of SufBCD complex [Tritonibacter mobilis]WHQ83785.1 component of SufBCD complex [Tritonibacter mobilis]